MKRSNLFLVLAALFAFAPEMAWAAPPHQMPPRGGERDGYRRLGPPPPSFYRTHAHRPSYRHERRWAQAYRPSPLPFLFAPIIFGATTPAYRPAPTVVYETNVVYAAPVQASATSEVYRDGSGRMCREYQTTASVAGALQEVYGTACLQPDGAWRIVD